MVLDGSDEKVEKWPCQMYAVQVPTVVKSTGAEIS